MRFPWSSESRRTRRVRRHKPLVQIPFVGHEGLLDSLETHLQTACDGTPQYVLLEGPAGSGKSSLITEFTLLRCRSAKFFVARINAGRCISDWACAAQLFEALQARGDAVLKRLYEDSKRIRKALSTDWEEDEFRTFLMSVDWAELQEADAPESRGVPGARGPSERGDVLRQLLSLTREHPWGVGAATICDQLMRPASGHPGEIAVWQGQWAELLEALKARGLPSETALVLVFDQLDTDLQIGSDTPSRWIAFWRSLLSAVEATPLPMLAIWAGTPAAMAPVREALDDRTSVSAYTLEALDAEAEAQLLNRVQRALPRDGQTEWQRYVSERDEAARAAPGRLILSASALAAQADIQKKGGAQTGGISDDIDQSIDALVEASRQRSEPDAAVFDQCLEVVAFLPPETLWTVDDLMQLCHLETLGLEPADGRDALEALLGTWVRYGLLQYDGYAEAYLTGHSLIQDGLRQRLYPNEAARQEATSRRYIANSLLAMIRKGDTVSLGRLYESLHSNSDAEHLNGCMSVILPAFRNMISTMTKDERQQVAAVLSVLHTPFVLDMLHSLMRDEEDQVRSRAVQSLTELEGLDNFPLLLEALQDPNSDVRWIATRALIDIDTASTVEALIHLLADEDKEVGRVAAEGLGRRGDQRAVPHLIEAMQDRYPLLRESAAIALGLLADQRAVPALREGLNDESQKVRRSAEAALARFPA